jgi:hypothetical protein
MKFCKGFLAAVVASSLLLPDAAFAKVTAGKHPTNTKPLIV